MTTFPRTALYGIAHAPPDDLLPVLALGELSRDVAATLDAALARGGIATPAVADLLDEVTARSAADDALAARLANLERARSTRCTVTGPTVTAATATRTAVPFTARTARSLAAMWSPAAPTRLVAPFTGEYDLSAAVAWAANPTGQRALGYRLNGGGDTFFDSDNAPGGAYGGEQTGILRGLELTAGQYLEVLVLQNSGTALPTGAVRATLTAGAL